MDWRLISAVAPVAASFGLIALSAGTATAADAIKPKKDITNQAQYCMVSEPVLTERGRLRLAMRRAPGEERSVPRMALMLGVAF
jgi:hypothetical protein